MLAWRIILTAGPGKRILAAFGGARRLYCKGGDFMRYALIVLLGLVIVGGATTSQPTDAAFPGANGKIAFHTTRDVFTEIYTMNSDGSGLTRLTNNAADDQVPAWSPDGSQIAFTSSRDGNEEVYVMNSDGLMPSRRQSSAIESSPRRPSRTMRIFSSAENFRRVLRRISRTFDSGSFLPDMCTPSLGSV